MGHVGLLSHVALHKLCACECRVSAPWRVCLFRPCERSVAWGTERVHGPITSGRRQRVLMRPLNVVRQGTSPLCLHAQGLRCHIRHQQMRGWGHFRHSTLARSIGSCMCSSPGAELRGASRWSNTSSLEWGGR